MAKYVPKIVEPILNYVPSPKVENITSYASKAIRAKILLDRMVRGFEKEDINGPKEAYETDGKGPNEKTYRDKINKGESDNGSPGYTDEKAGTRKPTTPEVSDSYENYITLVDFDYVPTRDDEIKRYKKINLNFIPRELDYSPETKFHAQMSFGRNTPFYQYTGAEDVLRFTIDWFSERSDRKDVIFHCRWVEALSKGNGNEETPHRLKLIWGKENLLWDDALWIVESAKYKLSNFNNGYRDKDTGKFISTHLLPQQAHQTVILKRVSNHNRTTKDIMGNINY